MVKKFIALVCISSTIFSAEHLYTDTYLYSSGIVHPYIATGIPSEVSVDALMSKKAVFSTALYFQGNRLNNSSQKELQKIVKIIRDNGTKPYYIAIVGHTSSFVGQDHSINLNFWSSMWHNIGDHSISRDVIAERINRRIYAVYNSLKESGVDIKRVYTENRMDRDPISTEAIDDGRKTNQRIAVTLYY